MTDDIDLTPEYIDNVCRAAPFADNDAGIPQMVALIRALSSRLAMSRAAYNGVSSLLLSVQQESIAATRRTGVLEAQLAQAVEALRYYNVPGHEGKEARATLAKIGEGHE
jgi:hypothetical protein